MHHLNEAFELVVLAESIFRKILVGVIAGLRCGALVFGLVAE